MRVCIPNTPKQDALKLGILLHSETTFCGFIIYCEDLLFMLEAKTIICSDCNSEFEFTSEEAKFFNDKGFTNLPRRCLSCRQARKDAKLAPRQLYDAVCATCNQPCQVPFNPEGKTVYCKEHYVRK